LMVKMVDRIKKIFSVAAAVGRLSVFNNGQLTTYN
jgi:hypothetical protein